MFTADLLFDFKAYFHSMKFIWWSRNQGLSAVNLQWVVNILHWSDLWWSINYIGGQTYIGQYTAILHSDLHWWSTFSIFFYAAEEIIIQSNLCMLWLVQKWNIHQLFHINSLLVQGGGGGRLCLVKSRSMLLTVSWSELQFVMINGYLQNTSNIGFLTFSQAQL